MNEVNLLHYIQSWDFVDQLIEDQVFDKIYADVWHLFPNCTSLLQFDSTTDQPTLIILSRLTVAQFFEMYDITNLTQITIVNLRVWVAGIGHKFAPEFDDIGLMTWYGWKVYEPISLSDLNTTICDVQQPTYVRITHRHVPDDMGIVSQWGMWYQWTLSQSVTYMPASMIEAVWWLPDTDRQYVLVSDWSQWYLSQEFVQFVDDGWVSVVAMEQSPQTVADYVDRIQMIYPKHKIIWLSIGTDAREWHIIVDEYRDEWYGCDSQGIGQKL